MKKTKKIVEVVDDFDGTPADQTVRFAFNGASYEIDLSREHFEEFAEAIQPYIKAGRKVGQPAVAATPATPRSAWRMRRSAPGRRKRGATCPTVVVFPLRSLRPTARPTPDSRRNCGRAERRAHNSLFMRLRGGTRYACHPSCASDVSCPWRRRYSRPSRCQPEERFRPRTGQRYWSW